jgi:hemerythrin superfamily protein
MKATELLKSQHQDIIDLFEKLQKRGSAGERGLFDELASMLVAHAAIEREIFYPACEKELGESQELTEALVEHGVIDFCLYVAREAIGKDEFEAKIAVLRALVLDHIEEEEESLLPRVDNEMDEERLEALGEEMEERFEQAESEDYRESLEHDLARAIGSIARDKTTNGQAKRRGRPRARAGV